MAYVRKILQILGLRKKHHAPDIRYADPSHANFTARPSEQKPKPESHQGFNPLNYVPGRQRPGPSFLDTVQNDPRLEELTLSYLKTKGKEGASYKQINWAVCHKILKQDHLVQKALRQNYVREHLNNLRGQLKNQKKIRYDADQKIWFFGPTLYRDLTEREEKFLANREFAPGWKAIDAPERAVEWIHQNLSFEEFEHFCAAILEHWDVINVEVTEKRPGSAADGGIDGWGDCKVNEAYQRMPFQAKCYADHNWIPDNDCASFYGRMARNKVKHGFFITTSWFSDRFKQDVEFYRKENGVYIEMVDKKKLSEIMLVKKDSPHGFGLHKTDLGLYYMNPDILRQAGRKRT